MRTYETLKHTIWECKYHVVFMPKCRRKVLYAQLRRDLGPVVEHSLCGTQRGQDGQRRRARIFPRLCRRTPWRRRRTD